MSYQYAAPKESDGGSLLKTILTIVALVGLAAANVYLFLQVRGLQASLVETRESLLEEMSKIRETSSVTVQSQRRTVEQLRKDLEDAQARVAAASGAAKAEAIRQAEQLVARVERESQRNKEALTAELTQAKEALAANASKIGEVSTEVSSVKTEVASAKTELEKTIAELKRTQGDLGIQSGLIATNSKELQALKALGERNYYEFRLGKTKEPQRFGDVSLKLKKADPKKNRYTIELIADDKLIEKKDKTVNEPVQFLMARARQPYEIVVNQIGKDLIVGYVSAPKVQQPRGND
jgi:DNA repair exonuclease SbcCD ATPase subunit